MLYLSERCPSVLDGDLAVVGDSGPDGDGLPGHVAAPVQADPAGHWPRGEARQTHSMLDLAVKGLLSRREREGKEKNKKLRCQVKTVQFANVQIGFFTS